VTLRWKIGTIAIALLATALALSLGIGGEQAAETWTGAFLRVGLVLAGVWLALPQLRSLPPWATILGMGLLLVLARWPRYFIVALVVAALVALIRPRQPRRVG